MAERARPLSVARVIGVLSPGGAQLSALRLAVALRAHGVSTRLYAGDATPEGLALAAQYSVPVEAFAADDHLQWVPSDAFATWLRPRLLRADLVHAHMFGAWWAASEAAPEGVPVVASEHNALAWPFGDYTARARAAVPRLAAFFAHGPSARTFAEQIGVPLALLLEGRSIIGGFDERPLPGLPVPRVTFAGRMHPEKGPDVLLEALALVRSRPAAVMVGDGQLLPSLVRRAAELDLDVRFPGWVDEPAGYIAGSAVHVVPSREEAWSQSAVLGLGLRVPVVASAVEGLPLTLARGRGVLVAPADPAALARAIDGVLDETHVPDPTPGRAYADRFSARSIGAAYARTYRRLTRPHSHLPPQQSARALDDAS